MSSAEKFQAHPPPYQVREFTVVPDWFIYDGSADEEAAFPAITDNFGLVEGKQWGDLLNEVRRLNESSMSSGSSERYKLVYAARHGEGWHNVAESKYSTKEWDAKWALLTGDGEMTWGPDPELTPLGEDQARDVNAAWKVQIQRLQKGLDAAPLPTRLFSSPFKRSAMTLLLTYQGILLPPGTTPSDVKGVTPVPAPYVKEDLREQYGDDHEAVHRSSKSNIQQSFPNYEIEKSFTEHDERFKVSPSTAAPPIILEKLRENFRDEHTCDERSTRSQVAAYTPGWEIEEGFAEQDEKFGVIHESIDAMTYRVADALRDIFHIAAPDEVIHISSHSGVMESLWRVTGRRDFKPATGAIVPLLVKWSPQEGEAGKAK
ncbi:hypothetical protein BCV69DRAFT_275647 [Microstroma glucosiphilum]|uniref:Phosphoglycerate mutase-like protein n=1 Tax=Pseudomicrostroma glucosiphilum TaxID=1684307 RepID=A0A316UBV9_9BASI|nr:hypothetical protein BCV69DRAFT_275647 [Pseudomicrostroma glucosiphilum]PWN22720.1 hypothetical protein BCV69DRAFT_275647 [Pseudomicrostroma glucosiphilum]